MLTAKEIYERIDSVARNDEKPVWLGKFFTDNELPPAGAKSRIYPGTRGYDFAQCQIWGRRTDFTLSWHRDNSLQEWDWMSVVALGGFGHLWFKGHGREQLCFPMERGDLITWSSAVDKAWQHGGPCGRRESLIVRSRRDHNGRYPSF